MDGNEWARPRSGSRFNRREMLRRTALGGALASLPLLAAACDEPPADSAGGGDSASSGGTSIGNFPETPAYNFVFVNHVTTNPFFVPTQYGIEDASAMLGTEFQWTGSETAVVKEMVNSFDTAITGEADGIAVCVIDPDAQGGPIQEAVDAGIPVIAYNADGTGGDTSRLAYVGQDLYVSGFEMGKRIVEEVGEGPVALFIATPGQLNIQP
ncbi:MAG: substrate-binding domain-containing protein, partial [Actinomycetota bacterium]|nr:substrate-binding domain-containing protein [Actinomycetota bacterium]